MLLQALKSICKDLRRKSRASASEARGTSSVAADIDQLLAPKSYEQLETLEVQVKRKLDSDEPIDYDYWEQLLRSLRVWKAKAKLRRVSQEIVKERLQALRTQQAEAAASVQGKTYDMLKAADAERADGPTSVAYDAALDPQPLLKLRAEDKGLAQTEEKAFLEDLARERYKTQKLGYVPMQSTLHGQTATENTLRAGGSEGRRGRRGDLHGRRGSHDSAAPVGGRLQAQEAALLQPRADGLRVEQVQPDALRPRQPAPQGRAGLQV
jgi:hypothetical protein